MAFVPFLPLYHLSHRPTLTPLPHHPPIHPCLRPSHRTKTPHASTSTPSPTVARARNPHELHLVYSVWNAVLADEGRAPKVPDEIDAAASTLHLIARTPARQVVGAARLVRDGHNIRFDRVAVLRDNRSSGVGRALVNALLRLAVPVQGAVYVRAERTQLGFFSILGFETLGNDFLENGVLLRTMVYRTPVCPPATGCVGLHHTSIRVSDIERSLAFYGCLRFVVTEKFVTSGGNRACYVEGLGTRLELVEASDGHGGLVGMQGVPPAGFDRLVFDVTKACTDLQSYLEHLQRRNGGLLEVAAAPARQVIGASVVSVATVVDPDALPIEFIRREAQVPSEMRTNVNW